MRTLTSIEALEARIAPAAVFHFTDVDGDLVTISSSKGSNFDLMNAANVIGGRLQTLDLHKTMFGAEFDQASITIGGLLVALQASIQTDNLTLGPTADFHIHEV